MLQHHDVAFTERNSFLYLALGLESWARRLDDTLDAETSDVLPRGDYDRRDRTLTHFVLGLVAMRRRLASVLANADGGEVSPPEVHTARDLPTIGELLR